MLLHNFFVHPVSDMARFSCNLKVLLRSRQSIFFFVYFLGIFLIYLTRFQARMKDSLVSSLKFTKIRDYELAWVEATVSLDNQTSGHTNTHSPESEHDHVASSDGLKTRTPLATDQLPVLNLPTGSVGPHKTVFVNEPKLSDVSSLFGAVMYM